MFYISAHYISAHYISDHYSILGSHLVNDTQYFPIIFWFLLFNTGKNKFEELPQASLATTRTQAICRVQSPPNYISWSILAFFLSAIHCLSMVEVRPSSWLSTSCVVLLRGDWAIFCHTGSRRVGRGQSAREKSLEILRIKSGPWVGQTVSYPTELSWLTYIGLLLHN